ncbi:MAG: ABC transporter ATP-binding protein [Verrucomicrobia bacterium]|nr:ABC transporter ATP-binding protein [Verrucomicrobiota bacterium]
MTAYVTLEHVSKSYGDREVLAGVSLVISAGERVALMGPSGSGKSTLLNCLGGIDRFDRGVIRIGDVDLGSASGEALTRLRRKQIATVFQFFHLLPTLSVLENAAFPLLLNGIPEKEALAKGREWMERTGLTHRMTAYPDQLSGGEMQRCAIARALAAGPKLLLADEPTGNLDSSTGDKILDLLETLTREQGITLVMVTHSETATRICDRTVHMLDGKVVEPVTA